MKTWSAEVKYKVNVEARPDKWLCTVSAKSERVAKDLAVQRFRHVSDPKNLIVNVRLSFVRDGQ